MTFFEKLFSRISGKQYYSDEHRYTVSFKATDGFVNTINSLASEGNRSLVIERAIGLYAYAIEQEESGRKLGFFVEENGKDVIKLVINLHNEPFFKT
jgi:hypothetical protein